MPISSRSTTPYFGRSYSLELTPAGGPAAGETIIITSDQFEPNALRISFDVSQVAFEAFWTAEIVIYNCDGSFTTSSGQLVNLYEAVIQEGDTVTLRAGYQADGEPRVIWTGPVFYTVHDRLDVTDQRLTIHSIVNRLTTTNNFVNTIASALSTQYEQALQIAKESQTPFQINAPQLQKLTAKSPCETIFFGNPHHYLKALADQNDLLSWFDSKGWNTDDALQQPIGDLVATYGPATPLDSSPTNLPDGTTLSLIGQPQQVQFGVDFRVLLDNRVQINPPLPRVGVQRQAIRQAAIAYPLGAFPPLPLRDSYVVVGVRFIGDTRGNAWYLDITGRTPILSAATMIGIGQSQQN
jgi:hypothetical protein